MLKRVYLRRFFAAVLAAALLTAVLFVPAAASSLRAPRVSPPALPPLELRREEPVSRQREGLVDLNRATEEELAALPGIGTVLAGRIVEYRTRRGDFASAEELMCVEGIGPGIYEKVRELVCVKMP